MNDLIICPLTPEYIDEVLYINSLSFSKPWDKDLFIKELQNKFVFYIVAKLNNTIVGYAGIWVILDEAHIISIAVHPNYRGLKISNCLMEGLFNLCISKNVNAITLEVRSSNIIAQNLYKKFGFTIEGKRKNYYDNSEDAIIMWNRQIKIPD